MSRTITRLPALAFPLNTVRGLAVAVPCTMCGMFNTIENMLMPTSWLVTEHSSFEQQHTAFTASAMAKFAAFPAVFFYLVFGSSGTAAVLVPACMFYTAYTLGGTSSERAHTKFI
jgi:hypothetical protein